jgi:glycosyltransferase involved in cell wall biosynthesis
MKQKFLMLFFILLLDVKYIFGKNLHLNINGLIKSANGLGQVSINLLNIYSLITSNISFLDSRNGVSTFYDLPSSINKIFNNQVQNYGVSVFTDQLTVCGKHLYLDMPLNSIKFAYSMVESTRIPNLWVKALNEHFDAVLVPDDYLIEVYSKSGVEIPIFCLPLPILDLEKCLSKTIKHEKNKKFVFGSSAIFSSNKNIEMLIKAFAKEFGNNSDVCLKIHSYHSYWNSSRQNIDTLMKELSPTNIEITSGEINFDDYLDGMSKWDCLILISKGEGFSITPRLAMGLGIPTILSNHTAHKTLCNSGYPLAVDFNILVESKSEFYSEPVGHNFDCDINDVCKALREMYNNHGLYLEKAKFSREWVKQYLPINLVNYYSQILKCNSIHLGNEDKIYPDKIITKSFKLFNKYNSLN